VNDFAIMQYAAGGMDAQRSALDVLARNVAVAQTAGRTHPVHPLDPQFAVAGEGGADDDGSEFAASLAASLESAPSAEAALDADGAGDDAVDDGGAPVDDSAPLPGQVVFAGARPSARTVTGIDAVSEMVSVLDAQRAFEADASVFDSGKRLVEKTLEVESAP
jgi:flagellar basal body rod protein FlgC